MPGTPSILEQSFTGEIIETLVCIDRDGTLIYDDKYYLGRQENWKDLIEFLPKVIEGVRKLQELEDAGLYMITNQSGVAIDDFENLTEKRAHEVCQEVLDRMEDREAALDGYFLCPHVDNSYVEEKDDRSYDRDFVCECDCIKPRLGMVFDALKSEGVTRDNVDLYVIGDRASDVETGLNAGGHGVLVPFENEPGQAEVVRKRYGDKEDIHIASNFLEAAEFIVQHASK